MQGGRQEGLDWLRGLMIVLMVIFHLVWFSGHYPYLKNIVYTFHMPVFLAVSGYLCNTGKKAGPFFRNLLHLAVAYAVFEAGYAAATVFLDVNESIGELSAASLAGAVLLHPVGPYWYLHTYIICSALCYLLFSRAFARRIPQGLVLAGLVLFVLDRYAEVLWIANGAYFFAGAALRLYGKDFTAAFPRTGLYGLAALAVLCAFGGNLNRGCLAGVLIVFLVVSVLLGACDAAPRRLRSAVCMAGRNTLAVLLFSPVFTMAAKALVPLLDFDRSRILFMVSATALVLAGSYGCAWLSDRTGLSRLLAGRRLFATTFD